MIDDVIARWHRYLGGNLPGGLDELLADDVVFYSPVVYTPQRGKPSRRSTWRQRPGLWPVRPREEPGERSATRSRSCAGDTAVLEFETSVDGKYVNGVDIIRCDDAGRIVEFRVMMRPLQGIQAVHEQMGRRLAAGS